MSFTFSASVAARSFDVRFSIDDGETLALLGANGAGKSTLLAVAAGLLRPDAGRAELNGLTLFDGHFFRAPHKRGICLLSQDALLFPHMSVLDNVAFGPRSAGASRGAARERALHWLGEAEALDLAEGRPAELSGGQAQRVAVARALAAEPELLLLDEPFASVDAAVTPALRRMLRRVLTGRKAIIATHNVLDALMLADTLAVLEKGRVAEAGDVRAVLERPRSAFAAGLAGLNFVSGQSTGPGLRGQDGVAIEAGAEPLLRPGSPAAAVFSPRSVSIFLAPPAGSPRNVLPVTVTDLEPRGSFVIVHAGHLSAEVSAAAAAELDLGPGSPAWFVVKAAAVSLYPL